VPAVNVAAAVAVVVAVDHFENGPNYVTVFVLCTPRSNISASVAAAAGDGG